ncbi:MAG: hypothetical protein AAGE01_26085, partial [Pseudomonadota bacterium]
TWHAQRGTPLRDLMALGGWKSYAMVLRYAHLPVDDVSRHAEALSIGEKTGANLVKDSPPPLRIAAK